MGKLVNLKGLLAELEQARALGQKIVLTNGCFDLLHIGHLRLLRGAKSLGDILVVGLNSDSSLRRWKRRECITPEKERAELLAALEPVDYVVIFGELTASTLIKEIKPDIYVKGAEYEKDRPLPETPVLEEMGVQTIFFPLVEGHSTTDIVNRILQQWGKEKDT